MAGHRRRHRCAAAAPRTLLRARQRRRAGWGVLGLYSHAPSHRGQSCSLPCSERSIHAHMQLCLKVALTFPILGAYLQQGMALQAAQARPARAVKLAVCLLLALRWARVISR